MNAKNPWSTKARSWLGAVFRAVPGKLYWAVCLGATILAYLTLKPTISIDPYTTFDDLSPLETRFYLSNSSAYPISDVIYMCFSRELKMAPGEPDNFFARPGMVIGGTDYFDRIDSQDKASMTCQSPLMAPQTWAKVQTMRLEILVTCKALYVFPVERVFAFELSRAVDGKAVWRYVGRLPQLTPVGPPLPNLPAP